MLNLDFSVETHLRAFWDRATGFVPNKFSVTLHGPMVAGAIREMREYIFNTNTITIEDRESYSKWIATHASSTADGADSSLDKISMLWACSDITIPMGRLVTSNKSDGFKFDTFKNIKYQAITGYENPGSARISFTIVDDWAGTWLQFFNALSNQNFSVATLTAHDSIDKMVLSVGAYGSISDPKTQIATIHLLQLFEYNAVVPAGFSPSGVGYGNSSKKTFTVNMMAPHPFHPCFAKYPSGLDLQFSDEHGYKDIGFNEVNYINRNKLNSEFRDEEFMLTDDWDTIKGKLIGKNA